MTLSSLKLSSNQVTGGFLEKADFLSVMKMGNLVTIIGVGD